MLVRSCRNDCLRSQGTCSTDTSVDGVWSTNFILSGAGYGKKLDRSTGADDPSRLRTHLENCLTILMPTVSIHKRVLLSCEHFPARSRDVPPNKRTPLR